MLTLTLGIDLSVSLRQIFWEDSNAINKNKDIMKNRFWWKGI